MTSDLDSLFLAEDAPATRAPELPPWPILVVDDDEEVHIMTRLVLSRLTYKGRPLELLTARSAAEAAGILTKRGDIAVALLDIVMETDDAGLVLARRIREEFDNNDVRIVLRTGQPGQAPVRDVIVNYDINDYKAKTELTSEKLFITIITALRSYDNIRTAREAQSASRLKSSFLATMSHEIRTPMNAVLGMLELMSHTGLDDDQMEMLFTARDAAGTLLRIIDDILDFSKIEAGRMDIECHPVALGPLVEGVADMLAAQARKRALDLHVHIDPAIPELLMGDPLRLRQVLYNLTGNAIKFTEKGGVTLSVRCLPGAAPGRALVRVAVQDTGIGIDDDVQKQLFQPFTQAESSTSRRFGGTGLGLSISRRLIDLMQGRIGLDSVLGQGSTFWFEIDLAVAQEQPVAAPQPALPSLAGITVLVAAETQALRDTVACYIEAAGGRVAGDGQPWNVAVVVPRPGDVWPDLPAGKPAVLVAAADSVRPAGLPSGTVQIGRPVRRVPLIRAVASAVGQETAARAAASPLRQGRGEPPTVEMAMAQGRLVLVAEDQPVNQMVIRRQLSLLGIAAEVTEDGRQALAAWRTGRFGLVLTDCNMPEMDGFELTAAIREAETGTGLRTPIIALTANAMAGESQRCLAAGMDGFLAKPLELDRLDRCLAQWLPPLSDGGAKAAPPPLVDTTPGGATRADTTAVLNLARTLELFSVLDDEARAFLRDFLGAARPLADGLGHAFTLNDAGAARREAHALAGVAKSAGADVLARVADRVEDALVQGKVDEARQAARAVPGALEQVAAAIASL
ncbi:signal transduction histidine kinase [Nitrospirillum amazonense]|uniref:Sensory/regulatory protein RpfC n=1 Tax=Nitrospirillum amazonense TaxID=28077 RepID=A0A560FP37_9PROT|nr:response regulator [Nitrospirillum amazonense]TWB23362.1 signal transduction histidine kinase [Nitrospirillum amazonense]